MKKCSNKNCKFTIHDDKLFNYCPRCGSKLINRISKNEKRKYNVWIIGETSFYTNMELTYEQAKFINDFLNEFNEKNDVRYTGEMGIDFKEEETI